MEQDVIIKSEKTVLKKLNSLLGANVCFLTEKNSYGDRRKYAFGFWIDKVAERYNKVDKADPGYRHKYDVDIAALLVKELEREGFEVHDISVGSWVHGWIHKVVYLK